MALILSSFVLCLVAVDVFGVVALCLDFRIMCLWEMFSAYLALRFSCLLGFTIGDFSYLLLSVVLPGEFACVLVFCWVCICFVSFTLLMIVLNC